MKLILATRGSKLALWQAEATRDRLAAAHPEAEIEVLPVQSSGDRDLTRDLAAFGSIGIFTAEVDQAVQDGRAHIGVHSLKDMPTTPAEGTVLAGVLARGPVEDALVTRGGELFAELGAGARVATGSARRRALLLRERPDIEPVGVRGNVETRLAKLERGEADALILARAGLVRLGLAERITEVLPRERYVPASCQGIVGLTCRAEDEAAQRAIAAITDREAWTEALAERGFLRAVGAGCNAAIGAHAHAVEDAVDLHVCVLTPDGGDYLEARANGPTPAAQALGEGLAAELLEQGAGAWIEEGSA